MSDFALVQLHLTIEMRPWISCSTYDLIFHHFKHTMVFILMFQNCRGQRLIIKIVLRISICESLSLAIEQAFLIKFGVASARIGEPIGARNEGIESARAPPDPFYSIGLEPQPLMTSPQNILQTRVGGFCSQYMRTELRWALHHLRKDGGLAITHQRSWRRGWDQGPPRDALGWHLLIKSASQLG